MFGKMVKLFTASMTIRQMLQTGGRTRNPLLAMAAPSTSVCGAREKSSLSHVGTCLDPTKRMENLDAIFAYHNDTKHHLERYANGPGYMDWQNQPNPFREYKGASIISLDLTDISQPIPRFQDVFTNRIEPSPVDFLSISQLFRDSLSLSNWKSFGGKSWALRCNPSSGNLHPTEGFLLSGPIEGVSDRPGVFHYRPKQHALERRALIPNDVWPLQDDSFLIGLSSIHWREAWKYGERAFRYCQHDVGHAIEAVAVAAGGLGWSVNVLDNIFTSSELRNVLGLAHQSEEASHEEPDCLILVTPSRKPERVIEAKTFESFVEASRQFDWEGNANRLSERQVPWLRVEQASRHTQKETKQPEQVLGTTMNQVFFTDIDRSFRGIVHQRRSAVDFDPDHDEPMIASSFFNILRSVQAPFPHVPFDPNVHLAIFVHRVTGLDSGLYMLVRNQAHFEELKAETRSDLYWTKPESCPDDLQLYRLAEGDATDLAKTVSCHQDIAKDSSFSLGMIARFDVEISTKGPHFYRRLFWETGMIGQRLYLQSEAISGGFRGTGIGCFFDDVMHATLGLKSFRYQSLYHFTVGYPQVDDRLATLDPYHHLETAASRRRSPA